MSGPFGQKEGRQKDRRIDYPRVLQDFIPSGATALLPINLNHILLKKGMETADHLLPLGCYSSFSNLPLNL